mmetsp:Transcript_3619/g.10863  ORF Transcript_3619/g.10863 Transcript_3619/m.10863 type:complete len:199 (+) Transcript_3619:462-1058(+)
MPPHRRPAPTCLALTGTVKAPPARAPAKALPPRRLASRDGAADDSGDTRPAAHDQSEAPIDEDREMPPSDPPTESRVDEPGEADAGPPPLRGGAWGERGRPAKATPPDKLGSRDGPAEGGGETRPAQLHRNAPAEEADDDSPRDPPASLPPCDPPVPPPTAPPCPSTSLTCQPLNAPQQQGCLLTAGLPRPASPSPGR